MHSRLKVALVLTILLTLVPAASAANRVVTIYPSGLAQNALTGEYEWTTDYDSTYAVSLAATRVTSTEAESSSIMAGFGMRKYLSGYALDGFYLGGGLTVATTNTLDKATSESTSAFLFDIGGRFGYKLQLAEAVLFDIGLNATMPVFSSAASGGESSSSLGVGSIGTGITIGIGFTF